MWFYWLEVNMIFLKNIFTATVDSNCFISYSEKKIFINTNCTWNIIIRVKPRDVANGTQMMHLLQYHLKLLKDRHCNWKTVKLTLLKCVLDLNFAVISIVYNFHKICWGKLKLENGSENLSMFPFVIGHYSRSVKVQPPKL